MKIVTDIEPQIKKEVVKEIPKSKILITTITPKKGQFMWKFNMRTKELGRIAVFDSTVSLKGKVTKKLEREHDCLYAVAINRENAAKKIMKLLDAMEA